MRLQRPAKDPSPVSAWLAENGGRKVYQGVGFRVLGVLVTSLWMQGINTQHATYVVSAARWSWSHLQLHYYRVQDTFGFVLNHLGDAMMTHLMVASSGQVGNIRLEKFVSRTQQDVAAAVQSLASQGAQEYVLDLRNNLGGLVEEGVEVARLFLDGKP